MPHNHICGLYFNEDRKRIYLPQVELKSRTTINPVCFTTELTQTFTNSNDGTLSQVRYTFPLYDGVAVSSYTISFGEKVLRGVVQQKDEAKKTYKAAVDRGETAGLLESLPAGVFGVTLGNVPAKTSIVVDITYCGELKHDAAIDGLRYTLPNSIAPKYGKYPGELLMSNTITEGGISITVDIDMASSAIRKVQSPSHPIAVSMGALSTLKGGDNAPFAPSQASATLTKGSAELADDFVLQLLIDDISRPQAILETHPTLPNQRALMTTLVPKFALESANPEIVFIADQSGSMSGSKNAALVRALKVFLKSLPLGVRFNICAFGNDFKFLFPKSQAYNEDNLNTALSFVESFKASYGGTEILKPITAAFKQHLSDLPLEVMLLTDGEIWAENAVFNYINEQIGEKKVDARVFALGIGRDVSHTLVEGVARAGNGFAQFVTQDEETDQKVMRMLKGALYAHTKDYEIEVHYDDKDEEKMSDTEDIFEIVERVNDCLKITNETTKVSGAGTKDGGDSKPISFFDTATNVDKLTHSDEPADRYAHLPVIDTPKLLQAPSTIPPLFPFNRSTLYLLLGPEATQKKVTSVTLRATSAQGALELNIPVHSTTATDVPTIHQLAARKATQDLEEGRGWLHSATVDSTAVKTKFASRFDELIERECVRLGEKFQVAGKWTSFVAVEANGQEVEEIEGRKLQAAHDPFTSASRDRDSSFGRTKQKARKSTGGKAPRKQLASMAARRYADTPSVPFASAGGGALFGNASASLQQDSSASSFSQAGAAKPTGGLFGAAARPRARDAVLLTTSPRSAPMRPPPAAPAVTSSLGTGASHSAYSPSSPTAGNPEEELEASESDEEMGFALFDGPNTPPSPAGGSARDLKADGGDDDSDDVRIVQATALAPRTPSVDQATLARYQSEMQSAACMPLADEDDDDVAMDATAPRQAAGRSRGGYAAHVPARKKARTSPSNAITSDDTATKAPAMSAEDARKMSTLIDLQTFSGAWGWGAQLLSLLAVSENDVKAALGEQDETVVATALAVAFLEKKVPGKKEVWEMVVSKARAYLAKALDGSGGKVGYVVEKAGKVFG